MLAAGVQLIIACHTGTRHQKKKKKRIKFIYSYRNIVNMCYGK